MTHPDSSFPSELPREFHTTRWSMVLACRDAQHPQSREALAELCKTYWYPVYAFLRRKGQSRDNAEDLTQTFFLKVLQQGFFEKAEPERGRLRSFLLKSVQNHLLSAHRRASMKPDRQLVSLDFDSGEFRYQREASSCETAEQLFERKWAMSLLEGTLATLRNELNAKFGQQQADAMVEQLNYAEPRANLLVLAEQIQISETALKVRLHRMRGRYREIIRKKVAETLGPGENIDDELQRLLALL